MLFWRTHRAGADHLLAELSPRARWSPQECIDFLVDRVGHERANAEAEVRRSFNGNYAPLYQVAYMMGGLQFRALHEELVSRAEMTNREFHDADPQRRADARRDGARGADGGAALAGLHAAVEVRGCVTVGAAPAPGQHARVQGSGFTSRMLRQS